ncbi:hypothetical protein HanXRQr2_Chr16g0745501 [Helianthus annuus]|uniref:Uncharacterized protein n=1 Tax=Helianthus annuus TaxID=4232 RepID=A0A9K3DSS9_HELAN|nr:hypothetical protein HanXRQr2_Chr16g0745501 [Helianthus annuus]KAJ0820990.1 hypothetical protein HanPSC8_Chr16g0714701 [Helianthus annuus]
MMVVLAVLFKRTNLNQLAGVAVSRPEGELAKDGRESPASRQMLKKSSFGKTSQENTKVYRSIWKVIWKLKTGNPQL